MGKFWAAAAAAVVVATFGASAGAGTGATPASVKLDAGVTISGIEEQWLVEAGGAWLPVLKRDAAAPTNPGGLAVIRGGNHVVPRASAAQKLDLLRAVGDESGDVLLWYTATNQQGGAVPHLRRVKPDNTLGFDKTVLVERLAGVAPDGAGGAYAASHVGYASSGVWIDMTKHRTVRFGPEGQVLWQVEEAGTKKPSSSSAYWSAATRGGAGVLVGYGVADDEGLMRPVILQRAAADGATVWKRTGLKVPGLAAATVPTGALGPAALEGRVSAIHTAADGTAIAVVYEDSAGIETITRIDAAGQQTQAFACGGGQRVVVRAQAGQVACVHLRAATKDLEVARYGVVGGALVQSAKFTTEAMTAWSDLDALVFTPGGQLLVSGRKGGATLTMALFSGTGKLLAKYDQGVVGSARTLGAGAGTWIGLGDDSPPTRVHFRGTFAAGGSAPPVMPLPSGGVLPLPSGAALPRP